MKISSPAFAHNQPVPVRYTCKGDNISPPLDLSEVPTETKSMVLIVEDLDAPNHWIHWLVYNIPGNIKRFEEGTIPGGAIDGICNGGTHGYEGPCPVYFSGTHHYAFRLYALNTMLQVPITADTHEVLNEARPHILAEAQLIGLAEGELVES